MNVPCVYCTKYFEPQDKDDAHWRSHKACRVNYLSINANLPSFLSEKLLEEDKELILEIITHLKFKFDSWIHDVLTFHPIINYVNSVNKFYIHQDVGESQSELEVKFHLTIDEVSQKFSIKEIYSKDSYYNIIQNILQKRNKFIRQPILVKCRLCNIVFDCSTTNEDRLFESHKECRAKHNQINSKFHLILDTIIPEENDKKILLNLHSFLFEKGLGRFYYYIENKLVFKLPYESYFNEKKEVDFRNHFFIEIHLGQNISDFLSKLKITKIICYDNNILTTLRYYFENIAKIPLHFPLEEFIKVNYSNDYKDYQFCQYCHQIFDVTPEMINNSHHDDDNFLLSHETCRAQIAEANEHFQSFLGSKIIEEDKKVLLMLTVDSYLQSYFHSWINTNNKVSILFKYPSDIEREYDTSCIEVFLLPISSESYKIKSIVAYTSKNHFVKKLLSDLNRTDIPVIISRFE